MTLIAARAVVSEAGVHRPGWIEISAGRIVGVGAGAPPRSPDHDFAEDIVVPGFVDIHVHGGGGASYPVPDEIARAAMFHRSHGTTTTLASLVTAASENLITQVRALAEATHSGVIAGIHLEGPWLSAVRCGAHDVTLLRDPDPAELEGLLTAADGTLRMVTLAPELPGSSAAINRLVTAEVVVAIGHTDADFEQACAAVDSGATVATHVFNAMRPLNHREPGAALALLEDPRITVELIADGVHLHPAMVRHVIRTAGPDRVALITDAMAAAGLTDGEYRLGPMDVEVCDGVARVRGQATIAGSTATMDRIFAAVVGDASSDARLSAAVSMTATTPARALGLPDVGSLRAGLSADLVVLDHAMRIRAVMAAGSWIDGPEENTHGRADI